VTTSSFMNMRHDWKIPFTEENKEWIIVIEDTNKSSSQDFKENTSNFVESWSLCKSDTDLAIFRCLKVCNFRWWMTKLYAFHVHKRFEIECTNFNKNFKGNEINDALINFWLVYQKCNTDNFSWKSDWSLDKANHIWDFRSVLDKFIWVIVCKFH